MNKAALFRRTARRGDCWLWSGATDGRRGYGSVRFGGKTRRAHRVTWELVNGRIPKGLDVCHRCDVPACINPAHLFIGTRKANMEDCVRKGRSIRRRLRFGGLCLGIEQWAARIKIKSGTLRQRLYAGWTIERALTYGVQP